MIPEYCLEMPKSTVLIRDYRLTNREVCRGRKGRAVDGEVLHVRACRPMHRCQAISISPGQVGASRLGMVTVPCANSARPTLAGAPGVQIVGRGWG